MKRKKWVNDPHVQKLNEDIKGDSKDKKTKKRRGEVGYGRGGELKELQTVHDTYGENTSKKTNYGREEPAAQKDYMKGVFYDNLIPLKEINDSLKKFGAKVTAKGKEFKFVTKHGEYSVEGDTDFHERNFITYNGAYQIAERISQALERRENIIPIKLAERYSGNADLIYEAITGKEPQNYLRQSLEQRIAAVALTFFSASTIFFLIQKIRLTGFVIHSLGDSSPNYGILLSVLGLLIAGFLLSRTE